MLVLILLFIFGDIGHCSKQCNIVVRIELKVHIGCFNHRVIIMDLNGFVSFFVSV
jgi:hypothetical protein